MMMSTTPATPSCSCLPTPSPRPPCSRTSRSWISSWCSCRPVSRPTSFRLSTWPTILGTTSGRAPLSHSSCCQPEGFPQLNDPTSLLCGNMICAIPCPPSSSQKKAVEACTAGPTTEKPLMMTAVSEKLCDSVNGGYQDASRVKNARDEEIRRTVEAELFQECIELRVRNTAPTRRCATKSRI